ncbi:MAG: 30S ribosomal protein S6 [Syntrophales bacterium]|nr:30S ribosomal protein S6 [Syntrophales bacterium]
MRRYETIYIMPADLADADISDAVEKFAKIAAGTKGVIVKLEKWGKKRLAYKIKKQGRGFYVFMDFAGVSETVRELERNLKIDDRVLKYMTVVTAQDVDPEALQKEIAAAQAAAEAAEKQKNEPPPPRQEIQPAQPQAPISAPVSGDVKNEEAKGEQK